jgi:hypothetical protein
MEAMRCLKRRLPGIACHQMILDHQTRRTGPGGQAGTTLKSSVASSTPAADSSDKPLPDPPAHGLSPSPAY